MEILVAAIILIGFGVMLRIIRIQAAFTIIGIMMLLLMIIPYAGGMSKDMPKWMIVAIGIVLGINLIRIIFSLLFGRNVGEAFAGRLLYAIFAPFLYIIGAFLRLISGIR